MILNGLMDGMITNGGGHLRVKDAHVVEFSPLVLGQLEGADNLSEIVLGLVAVEGWGEGCVFEIGG